MQGRVAGHNALLCVLCDDATYLNTIKEQAKKRWGTDVTVDEREGQREEARNPLRGNDCMRHHTHPFL
jgi:hypothetical protein